MRKNQVKTKVHPSYQISKPFIMTLAILLVFISVFLLYNRALPPSYALSPGVVSEDEIVLTRPVINRMKTTEKAELAASQVADVYHRSEEISNKNIGQMEEVLRRVGQQREDWLKQVLGDKAASASMADMDRAWQVSDAAVKQTAHAIGTELHFDTLSLESLLSMSPSTYSMTTSHLRRLAAYLVREELSADTLDRLIQEQVDILQKTNENYQSEYSFIGTLLHHFIQANMVFDEEATQAARNDAYQSAMSNPIMIEKGTRIVSRGDKISKDQYQILKDADLLDSGKVDFRLLMGCVLGAGLMALLVFFYLRQKMDRKLLTPKVQLSVLVTLFLPFVATAYLADYSALASPVYFAAIILTAYYGMKTALVLSTALTLLVFPMTYMNFHFLFCALFGLLVSSYVTDGFSKRDKYAFVIFLTAAAPSLASLSLDLSLKTATSQALLNAAILAATGALSAVAAVGFMPLYEVFLDAVSPLRLIDLSNPNNPLLKRMLLEAPGTSQHSMMVANLSEVAADAIGADSLLTRVGALYHDIGKLENPAYFTENQEGENPHDFLPPNESARIIFAHVTDGLKMAEKNNLPEPLWHFIDEHHGKTVLASIYAKAVKLAESHGLPQPDPRDYTYPGRIPHSKETGIVMIADSVEAAMKSTGYREIDKAEALIRKIVKNKNDQDQLVESGLSYQEVEQVIQAFLKVYAGQFHERVKYPDASPIPQKTV